MLRMVMGLMVALIATSARAAPPAEAEAMLAQLSKIRLDKKQVFSVRDISLSRDAMSISLNRGTLMFTEPVDGKVTGAVFIGSGDILLIPPDRIEKQQLFRYTRSALLNEHFETAMFRFTDNTPADILRQYREHAIEEPDPGVVEDLARWESEIQRRGTYLNDQLLADFLSQGQKPFFLAQIEGAQLGWFDAVFDERRTEEVFVQQRTSQAETPLLWTSFNRRDQVRDPQAFAHEDKTIYDIVAAGDDGKSMRLKFRVQGERVLDLPPLSAPLARIAIEGGADLFFVQRRDSITLVLPEPSTAGAEVTLELTYMADPSEPVRIHPTVMENAIGPASYRDQWIVDGLANYSGSGGDRALLETARAALLAVSPEGGTYESRGPLYVGVRMAQPQNTSGYVGALANKSLWVIHMLKEVLQADGKEGRFGALLQDIKSQYQNRTISTFDFKALAERQAGKPLDWFFDSWVFDTGIPEYKLDYKLEPGAGGFVLTGSIQQSGVPPSFEMPVPLYADDVLLGSVHVSSDGGEFRFVTSLRPQQVRVDPLGLVLKR